MNTLLFFLRSDAALSNPFIPPLEVDTSLVNLYDEIRNIVRGEVNIISAVFPQPAVVIQVFLQRIFAQSVSSFSLSLYTSVPYSYHV